MNFDEYELYEIAKAIHLKKEKDLQKYETIWENDYLNDTIRPVKKEVSLYSKSS